MTVRKDRVFQSDITPLPDKERVLRFTTSTEDKDRDGDIILSTGWNLDNYRKNPVVLFGHDYSGLPVGKTINIEIDQYGKRLIQDIQFPTKEEYEFGNTVYVMAKAGYLNTTSVGFVGIEHEPMFDENRNYLGRKYIRQELLETSIVPVPSNPSALLEARSKGLIKDYEMKYFARKEDAEMIVEKVGASISAKNKELLQAIFDEMESATKTLKGCRDRLKEMLVVVVPSENEDEEEPMMESVKTNDTEITKALSEIITLLKSNSTEEPEPEPEPEPEIQPEKELEIQEETEKDTLESDNIDLDSLVDPDEIDCTAEEFEKAFDLLLENKINQIKGGK